MRLINDLPHFVLFNKAIVIFLMMEVNSAYNPSNAKVGTVSKNIKHIARSKTHNKQTMLE